MLDIIIKKTRFSLGGVVICEQAIDLKKIFVLSKNTKEREGVKQIKLPELRLLVLWFSSKAILISKKEMPQNVQFEKKESLEFEKVLSWLGRVLKTRD